MTVSIMKPMKSLPKTMAATVAILASLIASPRSLAQTERTPPIAPKITEAPIPPAVTLPPPPAAQPGVPAGALSADDAVAITLQHQAAVTAAVGGVQAARGRTQQANAGLLPSLGLSMTYSQADTISGTGSVTSGSSNGTTGTTTSSSVGFLGAATIRQLVYDFQHTRDIARQARALEMVARGNLTKVEADLVLSVKQAFYALAQANRLVAVNQTNVQSANAHLDLAKARLNSGMGLPSDVVRAETAVSEALLSLNLARNTASLARVTIDNTMGIDVRTPFDPSDSGEPPVPGDDVNALMSAALQNRPEMVQANASLKAATAALRAARTTDAPSVAGTLGVGARDTNFFPNNDSLTVGGTVTWNIDDAGFTTGRVREARGNLVTAQASVTTTQQNVLADVAQAYLNLRSAEQRVDTAKAEVANAEESVRLAEGRYKAGIGTFLDVTDAQAALLLAQTNLINAQAAVDIARATMAHAVGTPPK